MARRTAWTLFLAFLPGLCGCTDLGILLFGVGSTPSRPYPGRTVEQVWEVLQDSVNETYDIKRADDKEKYIETDWNEHLAPMYKLGRRYRVRAWVKTSEETGVPFIEVSVEREINSNIDRPLISTEADWEFDDRDEARERNLIWTVNLKFQEIAPSEEALHPKPSKYRRDPEEKRRDELWGNGEKKDGEEEPGPGKGGPEGEESGKGGGKGLWK